uniref:Uncharacterized protein n=1 Tax=Mycena chlorophos TaxID=658473 RepID=A0ABQ0KV40_MYCCL|nr:predicted protein [Mycena chlorophos]
MHTSVFKTIDDLRVHTWIVPQPAKAPRCALFTNPVRVGGGVTYASSTARRIYARDDLSVVVFLQTPDQSHRRNLLLFPATMSQGPAICIHGDVLVCCMKGNELVPPEVIGEQECRRLIQRWWAAGVKFDAAPLLPALATPI